MDVEQFISTFPLFVVGLAAVVSLISFRDHYPTVLKKMSLLWVINFFIDCAGHITKHLGVKNHWIYNIHYWIMYLALAYLYQRQIQNEYVRRSISWFYVLFSILVVFESICFGVTDLQTIIIVAGGVFIIFLSASYFRQLYLSEETERITRDPWFWFSFGFLINFGGTVPFLGMLNYLWERFPQFTHFYYLYFSNSFTIFLNILIIAGFLCRRNYQKSH
ncbi:hypothetical protein SAMN05518672_10736 [Chitinophaga sp. CF118]|uniref:hypothetical protein n=1 Tax=Chitinophaga sp. CF118 TaxID=1884367 RepID=UPI0008F45397|nr:hypothetical protein [Chitinophaga sp. CF118]SFE50723.1 hypothetical protein SAMN05518672_10736 [Chitinophaga sp. CF118]